MDKLAHMSNLYKIFSFKSANKRRKLDCGAQEKSRKLGEKLEVVLNFLRWIATTSTATLVFIISNSKELEVPIQLIAEKQPQQELEHKNVEVEEELQKPITSNLGEVFFKSFFKKNKFTTLCPSTQGFVPNPWGKGKGKQLWKSQLYQRDLWRNVQHLRQRNSKNIATNEDGL